MSAARTPPLRRDEVAREVVAAYLHGCEPEDITALRLVGNRLTVARVVGILWRAGVPCRQAGVSGADRASSAPAAAARKAS